MSTRWFERLLTLLQCELWSREAGEIRSERIRKQKMNAPLLL